MVSRNIFVLLVLTPVSTGPAFLGCTDLGAEVKELAVVPVGSLHFPGVQIEIIGPVIYLNNSSSLPVYYDTYPTTCEDCVNRPPCTDPSICPRISPNGVASLEMIEGGTTIRWWHLVLDSNGASYAADSLRYVFVP